MRFVKRAVEADLARFKAYVEFGDVRGLEYKSKPAEMEQHRDEDEDGGDEAKSKSEPEGQQDDNRDRDSEREERAGRREERRKALTTS
jgi:hypothetical protein